MSAVQSATPYRCIAADPAWKFGDKLPGPGRGAAKHYAVMPTADICRIALPPIADDAILFLWRVAAMQQDALDVVRAWGFTLKSEMVWVKITGAESGQDILAPKGTPAAWWAGMVPLGFGMGRSVRAAHETCLIATRGKASRLIQSHAIRSVFFAPKGRHSEKPDEFYALVEALCPGPRLELFSRRERAGWTGIGNEMAAPETLTPAPRRTSGQMTFDASLLASSAREHT